MTPEIVWSRMVRCAALGVVLGPILCFLWSFPRKKGPGLQLLCAVVIAAGWVYLSFGICGADIRMGYLASATAGFALWQAALGRPAGTLFCRFWRATGHLFRHMMGPLDKIRKKFAKNENFSLQPGKNGLQ